MEAIEMEISNISKKIDNLRVLVLDVMSHYGYPVGEVKISYNCFSNKAVIRIERSEKKDNYTITISENL